MSERETTCLDEMMMYGIRGREEDFLKEYYLKEGVSEEHIDNAVSFLNAIGNSDFKSMYQCIPYLRETKLFHYIGRELEYTGEHELVLSMTEAGRIKAEELGRTYKNRFCKTYDTYGRFLDEWEEIE